MAFNLPFPTIDPEMSYADIAGVVALFFTAFTFGFTIWQWNRRRKSDQIKIARELIDRIETKRQKFDDFCEKNRVRVEPPHKLEVQGGRGVQEFAEYFLSVLNEIDYYFYLVDKHELEENVLKYDWAKLFDQLDYFYPIYEIAREGLKSTTRERLIEESWDRLRKSPWTGPYLPRKQT